MSSPTMANVTKFWSALLDLNNQTDALMNRCLAVQPSAPISREIPIVASIEAKFENLGLTTASPNSDAIAGRNIKRPVYTNGGSRVYIREIGFQTSLLNITTLSRIPNDVAVVPANFRWNFQTSIDQRWYATKSCLANAGGRFTAGNHLAFREPLIIEPMETLIFECELLSSWSNGSGNSTIISMLLSGYREGF